MFNIKICLIKSEIMLSLGMLGVGSLLQGIGSVGSLFGNKGLSPRKQMALQHDYWVKQFNMQNDYNKPINQMRRLQEAGINPHSMAGVSAGAAANPSIMTVPNAESPSDRFSRSMSNLGSAFNSFGNAVRLRQEQKRQEKLDKFNQDIGMLNSILNVEKNKRENDIINLNKEHQQLINERTSYENSLLGVPKFSLNGANTDSIGVMPVNSSVLEPKDLEINYNPLKKAGLAGAAAGFLSGNPLVGVGSLVSSFSAKGNFFKSLSDQNINTLNKIMKREIFKLESLKSHPVLRREFRQEIPEIEKKIKKIEALIKIKSYQQYKSLR